MGPCQDVCILQAELNEFLVEKVVVV
jgi:hypothetical protein